MASFQGKVVAVTGAGSGMGLATAQLLAERGAKISLADINESSLKEAVASLPDSDSHIYEVVDVRDGEAVDKWIQNTVKKYGKLDGAVNMAGVITHATPVAELTDKDWDFVFAVNAKGVFNCIRSQLKAMSAGASIVSAASTFGQFGAPGNAAYCASKAAVINLSRTAAKENQNIRVNCVSPGSVNTPLSRGENPEDVKRGLQVTAQKRRAEPIEIARVIAYTHSFKVGDWDVAEWQAIWPQLVDDARLVMEACDVILTGPTRMSGTITPPVASAEDGIVFNGVGDYGHDAFVLSKQNSAGSVGTARKPYDLAVCCVLLRAYRLSPRNIKVDPDGRWDDELWKRVQELLSQDRGLDDIWDQIPTTIMDAMLLCEKIGERYLFCGCVAFTQQQGSQSLPYQPPMLMKGFFRILFPEHQRQSAIPSTS
ncbi:3-oxoacyl-[acyl-carrier-protein] reductase FabG [Colletotrichum sp. SAR 10_96]|nr:3-oxoacyl-[acyl-carrier-protein] reductase FabG [Colletotrichum sp. SAR 10_96]